MDISRPFILRPVATTLLMVALLIAGLLAYRLLPVAALLIAVPLGVLAAISSTVSAIAAPGHSARCGVVAKYGWEACSMRPQDA